MNFEENDWVLKTGLDAKTIEILQSLYWEINQENQKKSGHWKNTKVMIKSIENLLRLFH